jgi:hypothetical protein
VQNRTLSSNDIDWISFTAEKDSIFVIQASDDAGVYMNEYLYSSPSGSSIMSQTNLVAPKLVWTCPAPGAYYMKIIPYSTSYYGNYRFSIKKYSAMSIITFINPTSASTWSTGSSYSIQWVADTALFGTSVRIQLALDTTILQSITSSATNNGTYSWTPPTGLTSSNKYRIKISNYSFPGIYGFSQGFTISGIDPDPDAYEPDDSAAIAHTIAATGSAENHTCPFYDRDWYKFAATDKLLYVIKSTGAIKPAIYFYSTDAKTLLASANTSFSDTIASVTWFCPVAGVYYFRDTCYTYGKYQTMVNGYDSTAYAITVTAPHTGDTITVSQTCSIQWSTTIPLGGSIDIFLYNSAGIVATVIANVNNTGSYSWTVPSTVAPGNTYYVKVISKVNAKIFGNSGVFIIK